MKKFIIKNYKGDLAESVAKFKKTYPKMKIVEAYEDADMLRIAADMEPAQVDPTTANPSNDASYDMFHPVFDFGCELLSFATQVRCWHLNCDRHFEHIVLQDLYEACEDTGDAILEAVIGITGQPVDKFEFNLLNADLNYGRASIDKICQIRDKAAEIASFTDCGISNTLGGFCEKVNSVIYKLKQFGD